MVLDKELVNTVGDRTGHSYGNDFSDPSMTMNDLFHAMRLKRIDDINRQYAMSLSELDEWIRAEISKLYQEMEIKQAGWEAFEKGEALSSNPHHLDPENLFTNYDKRSNWKAGWEMAYASK